MLNFDVMAKKQTKRKKGSFLTFGIALLAAALVLSKYGYRLTSVLFLTGGLGALLMGFVEPSYVLASISIVLSILNSAFEAVLYHSPKFTKTKKWL